MKNTVFRRSMVIGLVLASSGCRTTSSTTAKPTLIPGAPAVLETLQTRAKKLRSAQLVGRLTYFGEKGRLRLKTILVAERDAKFRVETLSPLEQPLQVMVSDGQKIRLLTDGQVFEGSASATNISQILPVPLAPPDLVDAMLSGVPMATDFETRSLAWQDDSRSSQILTLWSPTRGAVELLFNPKTLEIYRVRLPSRKGHPAIELQFDRFESIAELPEITIAKRIRIKLEGQDHDLSLRLKEMYVNGAINPNLFTLETPNGVSPIPLLD